MKFWLPMSALIQLDATERCIAACSMGSQGRVYNLYTGTVFAGWRLIASQALLLVRGVFARARAVPRWRRYYSGL